MSEFIVLGLVPGTHIQITFIFWILLMVGLLFGGFAWFGHRTHAFRNWLIIINLILMTRQQPNIK